MENTKRIYLLTIAEVEELYTRPDFNTHEQLCGQITQSYRYFNILVPIAGVAILLSLASNEAIYGVD